MIGSGLRKLAAANGMKVEHGVAYGFLRGYATTLSEGSGIKTMVLSTRFADSAARYAFTEKIQAMGLDKEYKLNALEVQEKLIRVIFLDTIGTMKRIEGFIEVFFPMLDQHGASHSDICPECGMMLTDGRWKLVNGIAIYVHEACGERIRSTIETNNQERLSTGNYFTGAIGALLGSVIGSVVWTILAVIGYIASIAGLLIGFLAEKGYSLLGGKKGWGKLVILIIAVILGVVVGNLACEVYYCVTEAGFSVGESITAVLVLVMLEPEVRSTFIINTLLGLVFAALGVFGIMRATKNEAKGAKYIDLN